MIAIKQNFIILTFILLVNSASGQTLKLADLRKAYNYYKPTEHKQLLSKGFHLLSDTISTNQKRFAFSKTDTKEIIELTFTQDGEGGEYLNIRYFLPTEFSYKKFISTLPTYKFKYSKRNKRYQLPASSYSGENVYLHGLTQADGKKYYYLDYASYVDKALSGPRPEMKNNIKPPAVDNTSKTN
jgi:uncharacterized protein YxeA